MHDDESAILSDHGLSIQPSRRYGNNLTDLGRILTL